MVELKQLREEKGRICGEISYPVSYIRFRKCLYSSSDVLAAIYAAIKVVQKINQLLIESTVVTKFLVDNSSFSSQLINGRNKLECYIILGWKGLPWAMSNQ